MHKPFVGVTRRSLGHELVAGVTLIAISVPLNIGYAQIAGLPATAGLYALVLPTLVYVVLVSSRQVVASPDAAAAALVFSSLVGLGVGEDDFAAMAAGQAIVCGVILMAASVFRLGFLASFLSHPILVGFVAGLALEVLLSQTRKMLGLSHGEAEGFFRELADVATRLGDVSVLSLVLSVAALAALVAGRMFAPKVPAALIVLIAGTAATAVFGLDAHGVAVLGEVEAGPPQFTFPLLSWGQWLSLVPSALALALITMAEGVLMSRSYAQSRGYQTDSDQDLLAFGAANVASGLSLSFAVGSSTSRTAAMDQLGSRSQLPSVVLAAGTLLLLLFGTEMLATIPSPVIGAVVAMAVVKLLGVADFREIARLSRSELATGLACLVGVLVLGPLQGLLLAFVLSLIDLARRAARPQVDTLSSAPVVIIRVAGPVFFANGAGIADRLREAATDKAVFAVVLDAEGLGDIDVTGASALRRVLDEARARDLVVGITRLRPSLHARMAHLELLEGVRLFSTNRAAKRELSNEYRRSSGTKGHRLNRDH